MNDQSLTERPVLECAFAHPIMLLSYLVKNSVDRVSVICKLATVRNSIYAHVRQLTVSL